MCGVLRGNKDANDEFPLWFSKIGCENTKNQRLSGSLYQIIVSCVALVLRNGH